MEVVIPLRTYETFTEDRTSVSGFIYGFPSDNNLKVTWMKDSIELDPNTNSNLEMSSRFNFEYTLTWKRVSTSDFGSYTLQAKYLTYTVQDKFTLLATSMSQTSNYSICIGAKV